jgi:hypothetical protein
MMRKLYISLLLPFLMLLVQQGAVWHAIEHMGASDAVTVASSTGPQDKAQQDKELPADKLCEMCLAFAQLNGTTKTDVPLLSLLSFSHAMAQWVETPAATADAPALRNRGPPISL